MDSNQYLDTIKQLTTSKSVNVFSQACPLFVPLVEEGMIDNPAARLIVKEYLQKLIDANIDTLILGCTHFGLLEDEIRAYLGNVKIINSSTSLKDVVKKTLDEVGYNTKLPREVRINVTGDPNTLNIDWFTKEKLEINKVNIDE